MAEPASTPGDLLTLPVAHESRLLRAALAAARPLLSAIAGLPALRAAYQQVRAASGSSFEARILDVLDVRLRVRADAGAAIPAQGPVIVAANHPTGAIDGIVLTEVVRQVRPDVRLLVNHLLARVPELRESCFFVDPFGGARSRMRSVAGLRAARRWVAGGGALVIFPAGEVAWRPAPASANGPDLRAGHYADGPWSEALGRLAADTGATVVPAFLDGRNSPWFYLAGRLHPRLRTLLLGRELLDARGRRVTVALGAPVRADGADVTGRTRAAVERLATRPAARELAAIASPVAPHLLLRDVQALPPDCLLLSSGDLDVFCATAARLPHVLHEIGRLRELTFRAVGEGSGAAADLDRFDDDYQHLFVWHRTRHEIVGAYRIGEVDRLVRHQGVAGLYTSTLFRFDRGLLERLGPALELGRSFVRSEYQRSYTALLLLWKGIGRFVVRSQRYRVLFGPVSISSRYTETSQQLLRAFLAQHHSRPALTALVQAVNPPSPIEPPAREAVAQADVDAVDALVRRLEHDQGMPVLLRQYLRLDAELLGFNVDPAFGDALDALMMVDLARLPVATLQKYLGPDAGAYLASHRSAPDVAA